MLENNIRPAEPRVTERRWKLMPISGDLLAALLRPVSLRGGRLEAVHCEGLPEDVQVVAVDYDMNSDVWTLKLESAEWPPVPAGNQIERVIPQYSRTWVRPVTAAEAIVPEIFLRDEIAMRGAAVTEQAMSEQPGKMGRPCPDCGGRDYKSIRWEAVADGKRTPTIVECKCGWTTTDLAWLTPEALRDYRELFQTEKNTD